MSNKNLEKIYPIQPLLDFSSERFRIEKIFDEFKNNIKNYLDDNNILYEVKFNDKNLFKLELLIKNDTDLILINSENIDKIYLNNLNNFKQFY